MADELVERLLTDIADMMSQHVENWPYPRKIDTAIALISKTLDAALTDAVPRDVAESWKAKAENLSAARKEAATAITRLTEANAAQAREIAKLRALLNMPDAEWEGELTAEERGMIDAAWEQHKAAEPCNIPPPGWWCSRGKGHEGPCAARALTGGPHD